MGVSCVCVCVCVCVCGRDYDLIYILMHMSTDVYVDQHKKTYQALGYRRFNWISIWTALLSRISRAAISEVRAVHTQCLRHSLGVPAL